MAPTKDNVCLDKILLEVGEFGKFQKINFLLICIPVILSAIPAFSFYFAAGQPDYRCRIPECDPKNVTEYMPEWISYAVPTKNDKPAFCQRYQPSNSTKNETNKNACPSSLFTETPIKCSELVFPDTHTTIVNDFEVYCEENQWQLTLIGTLNGLGQFICLPFTGFISDKYGRKTVLIGAILLSTIVGTVRSFSTSIKQYMFFELLDSSLGAGAYSTGFILGIELVGPAYRVIACAILSTCFATGEILVGLTAWNVSSWRIFLRIIYLPGFIMVFYTFLIPESLRWLISKNKNDEALVVLKKLAKVNKTTISDKTLEGLMVEDNPETATPPTETIGLVTAMKNKTLFLRFLNCSFAWITTNLTYYGLSLNAVAISGNKYINFISVAAAEIPAYLLCTFLFDRYGRKICLSVSYLVVGIACISFTLIPKGGYVQIIVFIVGKCASTISFTAIYIFTAELFPTSVRHSVLANCSMFGRFGGMLAPQTPLLALVWGPLPLLMFGIMAGLAGFTSMMFPETLNTQLPDTIDDAVNISKRRTVNTTDE